MHTYVRKSRWLRDWNIFSIFEILLNLFRSHNMRNDSSIAINLLNSILKLEETSYEKKEQ